MEEVQVQVPGVQVQVQVQVPGVQVQVQVKYQEFKYKQEYKD